MSVWRGRGGRVGRDGVPEAGVGCARRHACAVGEPLTEIMWSHSECAKKPWSSSARGFQLTSSILRRTVLVGRLTACMAAGLGKRPVLARGLTIHDLCFPAQSLEKLQLVPANLQVRAESVQAPATTEAAAHKDGAPAAASSSATRDQLHCSGPPSMTAPKKSCSSGSNQQEQVTRRIGLGLARWQQRGRVGSKMTTSRGCLRHVLRKSG